MGDVYKGDRIEVRKPNGELIGLMWHAHEGKPQIVLEVYTPLGRPFDVDAKFDVQVPTRTIVLRSAPIRWMPGRSTIPTYILVEGKQSWLTQSKNFRRAR
jgi:hypothetical protein